ncbi:hypothetical protein VTO42DRAFT_8311 [Malbranchea cinnamomea]
MRNRQKRIHATGCHQAPVNGNFAEKYLVSRDSAEFLHLESPHWLSRSSTRRQKRRLLGVVLLLMQAQLSMKENQIVQSHFCPKTVPPTVPPLIGVGLLSDFLLTTADSVNVNILT